jgi:hypothetical protein
LDSEVIRLLKARVPVPELLSRLLFQERRLMVLWKRYLLTNYQYLLDFNLLNVLSFKSPSLHPMFPWVFDGYERRAYRIVHGGELCHLHSAVESHDDRSLDDPHRAVSRA